VSNDVDAVLRYWGGGDIGARVAVTTRHGGVSEGPYESLNLGLHVGDDPLRVVANRQGVARAFGTDLDHLIVAEQVHGNQVCVVDEQHRGRGTRQMNDAISGTDILITTSTDVVLVMMVADCVPIALVDPSARVLAAVHAGWRGTAAGVVGRALQTMTAMGAQTERIVAYLGPAVSPDIYQVDSQVLNGLSAAVAPEPLQTDVARPDGDGHWLVDLIAANRQQLRLAGIAEAHISASGSTTSDDDFFSDRAERPCGRFALMAQLLAGERPSSP
jgi:YfiH family protein